jgi:hypothetical protein
VWLDKVKLKTITTIITSDLKENNNFEIKYKNKWVFESIAQSSTEESNNFERIISW